MDTLINTATSSFQTTTGFSFASAVSWVGDNLIKLFLGTGLAALDGLKYWIIVLLLISIVVFFAYRAFRRFGV